MMELELHLLLKLDKSSVHNIFLQVNHILSFLTQNIIDIDQSNVNARFAHGGGSRSTKPVSDRVIFCLQVIQ